MKPLIFACLILGLMRSYALAIEDGGGNYLPGFYGQWRQVNLTCMTLHELETSIV